MPPRRRSKPLSPELGALGEAIRRLRLEAGLSQEQLAERAATDFTLVGDLERGQRDPGYKTLRKIAAGLATTVGAIADLADELHS